MKIQFLGTGADDWDWKTFPSGARGCTSTLIDDTLMIDAGASGWENLLHNHADPQKITELIVTHSHSDHFDLQVIGKIAEASGTLKIRASEQTAEQLRATGNPRFNIEAIHWGDAFRFGESVITVLPANHALENLKEESFHFLFETPGGNWLYALDGGWMVSAARRMLDKKMLSLIVWDATSGDHFHDWRFADHNDLGMIDSMRHALAELHNIDGNTRHIFNHIARTLWPKQEEQRQSLAKAHGGILAEDGMTITF